MTDFLKNVQYGDMIKNAFIQFLRQINHRTVPTGQEDSMSLIIPELLKASKDNTDLESQSVASHFRHRPDSCTLTINENFRWIEVRAKKDLPENFLDYFDDDHCDFFREQKLYPCARLVYIDVINEKIRSLYCGLDYNDPLQKTYWQDPCSYLDCSREQYLRAKKEMFEAIREAAERIRNYMPDKEDIIF